MYTSWLFEEGVKSPLPNGLTVHIYGNKNWKCLLVTSYQYSNIQQAYNIMMMMILMQSAKIPILKGASEMSGPIYAMYVRHSQIFPHLSD